MRMKPLRNGEITLSFTDKGKTCPSHNFIASQIYLLTLLVNKILAKISVFTVSYIIYALYPGFPSSIPGPYSLLD